MSNASPHILIIGAQRSGSTWLYELLKSCESVRGINSGNVEPRLLLKVTNHHEYHETSGVSDSEQEFILEKSVAYLELPNIANRAKQVLPDASIVAILRNPVDRAFSNWKFSTLNGFESRSFSECLSEEAELREYHGSATSPYKYVSRGLYWRQLAPWIECFPNLHIVQFEKIMATRTRKSVISELEERLRIREIGQSEILVKQLNHSIDRSHIENKVRKKLSEFYLVENQKLTDLGVDLRLWS